jgi:hypothetical protein
MSDASRGALRDAFAAEAGTNLRGMRRGIAWHPDRVGNGALLHGVTVVTQSCGIVNDLHRWQLKMGVRQAKRDP